MKFGAKLSSEDGIDYWVSSDLHFYHQNIMKFNKETRPYRSVDHMHESIIADWNSKVKTDDIIFHLGDFSFAGKEKTEAVISRLNGNIVWVLGNHDTKVFGQMDYETHHYLEVTFDKTKVCMMHYPISAWNRQGRGSVMLHGHCHGGFSPKGRCMDVGWDSVGEIIKLKSAVDLCLKKEVYCPDHHKVTGD